jgi:hypothetical protein
MANPLALYVAMPVASEVCVAWVAVPLRNVTLPEGATSPVTPLSVAVSAITLP